MPALIRALAAVLLMSGSSVAPALAQDAVALSVEGWSQEDRGGTIYHRCQDPRCTPGSRISYRRQTHRPDLPFAVFEEHHRRNAEAAEAEAGSKVRGVTLSDFTERRVDGSRVMSVKREVRWANGQTTRHVDGLVIGEGRSYTLVSDAVEAGPAEANFNGFLRNLTIFAGLLGG